jgi:hypothetical protein
VNNPQKKITILSKFNIELYGEIVLHCDFLKPLKYLKSNLVGMFFGCLFLRWSEIWKKWQPPGNKEILLKINL